MALDFLSVPAMSSEVERLFSTAGRMVTAERARLDANTIAICQSLRSWHLQGIVRLTPNNPVLFREPELSTTIEEQRQSTVLVQDGLGISSDLVTRDHHGRVIRIAESI